MRVLVCGGRYFEDQDAIFSCLDDYDTAAGIVVIHGACRSGADWLAGKWAAIRSRDVEEFPADWRIHGRAAGPIRNQRMLDEGKPDLVVAFPGGRGTADMVRRAKAAGVPVREIPLPDRQQGEA